jgi:hypothetical protein
MALFTKALSSLVAAGRFAGFGSGPVRLYTTYRAFFLPTLPKTSSIDGDLAQFQTMIEKLRDAANQLPPNPDELHLYIAPEFALNGVIVEPDPDAPGPGTDTSGSVDAQKLTLGTADPAPLAVYQRYLSVAQVILKGFTHPGLAILGTMAITTGDTIDGKPVAENRGFAITTGADGETAEFTKRSVSVIDGWSQDVTVRGEGPTVVTVDDSTGGKSVDVVIAVCLDYATSLPGTTVPIAPDMITTRPGSLFAVTGAGVPIEAKVPLNATDILISDLLYPQRSAVWVPVETYPFFYSKAPNLVATVMQTFFNLNLISQATLDGWTKPTMKIFAVQIPFDTVDLGGGLSAKITRSRNLPATVTDDDVRTVYQATDTDGATTITNGVGVTALAAAAQSLSDATSPLPWTYARTSIQTAVTEEVHRQLQAMNAASGQLASLTPEQLDQSAITNVVTSTLTAFVVEGIAADSAYVAAQSKIGADMTGELLQTVVVQPYVASLQDDTNGDSLLRDVVERAIATAAQSDGGNDSQTRAGIANSSGGSDQVSGEPGPGASGSTGQAPADQSSPTNGDSSSLQAQLDAELRAEQARLKAQEAAGSASQTSDGTGHVVPPESGGGDDGAEGHAEGH